jgi:hypothetical protein
VTDHDAVHHMGEVIAAMGNRQRGVARITHPGVERFAASVFYEPG